MDSANALDEKAAALAAKYSLDPERVRAALLQAEEFRFWRFRHHSLMVTEDAVAAEVAAVGEVQDCQWLLRPSLEEALALPRMVPSDCLDMFLNAEPWEVRQRRLLLTEFVPHSDAPFYTLPELCATLEGFVAEQNSQAPYLIETGRMVAKPGGESWAGRTLGPLCPDWPGLTPIPSRLREAVLKWRADFVQSLVPDIRAAARLGDRADKRAAARLWDASRSRLRDLLGNPECQDILLREIESLVRETCIGVGSVARMALLAAHCSAEIASGSYRKTRSALGALVQLDGLQRPRLMLDPEMPLVVGYNTLLKRDAGSQGERVAAAVSKHSRQAEEEAALLKTYINDYVRVIEEAAGKANLPGIQDGELRKKAEKKLAQAVLALRNDYRARVAAVLGLALPEYPRPLDIPDDANLEWKDISLRLEGDDQVSIRISKGNEIFRCQTRSFESLTFANRSSQDEFRPTELWLMLAGILKHSGADPAQKTAKETKPSGGRSEVAGTDGAKAGGNRFVGRFFQISLGNGAEAKAERTSERRLLTQLSAKLQRIFRINDEAPFDNRKGDARQHAWEILFGVEDARNRPQRALWQPGHKVSKRSDRQLGWAAKAEAKRRKHTGSDPSSG